MVRARKYVVKKRFQGMPKRDDFEIVEHELPPLEDGDVLVKAEFVSVDPYMRAYHSRNEVPYDQFGYQVGTVLESKDPDFPVGCSVVSHKGWADHVILNKAKIVKPTDAFYRTPDLKGLSPSIAVGAVGLAGTTAYFGFLEICQPKEGETVVVTGAAGSVGSIVGQIAKIKGCKVIGFAGSNLKCQWLEKELGFDKAFNYKTVNVAVALKEAAPNGVDCYFDNVGGEISSIIINQMNMFGRISVCGSISSYNEDINSSPKAPILQPALVFRQLKMEGFLAPRWISRWSEAFNDITTWIVEGKMKTREDVTEGFDHIYDAFIGMLSGENIGKAVVKL